MSIHSESLSRIEQLKAELAQLQTDAVKELRNKRDTLVKEIAHIDAELAELTGAAPVKATARPKTGGGGKSIPLTELKALLEGAPEKTLNIRKAGLELANIKTLATANPHLLKLGGKGPWPTVTMLK